MLVVGRCQDIAGIYYFVIEFDWRSNILIIIYYDNLLY